MKRYMKYFLIFILILMFAGCSNQAGEPPLETTSMPSSIPTATPETTPGRIIATIPPTSVTFLVYRAESFGADDSKDYIIDWQHLIQQKFNIRIVMHDLHSYMTEWSNTKGETNMLAECSDNIFADIMEFRDSGVVVPYNDYLKDCMSWAALPDEFKGMYTDAEGNIWAIPKSDSVSVLARAYNKDWMEKLSLDPPKDVNELYEVLNAFANSDPDSNGQKDTFGTAIAKRVTSLITFKDVFEANGCRLSYTYDPQFRDHGYEVAYNAVPVGFDPESGLIKDYSATKGMLDSLTFIKGLLDNGIAELGTNNITDCCFTSTEYGSQIGLLEDNLINTDKYIYTYSLNGPEEKLVSSISMADNEAYLMYSGTIDKEKVASTFVDLFYGSKEGYKVGYTGLTGQYFKYEEDGNGFVVNEKYSKGVTHIDLVGELSWFDLDIRRPDLDSSLGTVNPYDLLQDERIFILMPRHMAFMENMEAKPVDGSGSVKYEKALINVFSDFYKEKLSPQDVIDQLEHIGAIYNLEELIHNTNEKWIYGD